MSDLYPSLHIARILTECGLGGRRILGPRAPDGSSYYYGTQQANDRFIQNFAWSSVRNYNVNIAIERGYVAPGGYRMSGWDEEVELYDIRGKYHRAKRKNTGC